MKKSFRIMLAVLLVAVMMTVSAAAASYNGLADELKTVGVFQGTDSGYQLDRAPTRAEAAVMLVRLLGKETFAKTAYAAQEISQPFTDVPDWAAPYVAYLYENGLTKGVSETRFGSQELCSAQMYCTFALRALGYSDADASDFTYTDALDFASDKGIADSFLLNGDFLRDQLVAISYQTLATPVKGEDTLLLDKLVADGSIDETAAAPLKAKINAYLDYTKAVAPLSADNNTSMDLSMKMNATINMPGADPIAINDMNMNMKMIMSDNNIEMESTTVVPLEDGTSQTINQWMKDGYIYMTDGVNKTKTKTDYMETLAKLKDQMSQMDTLSACGGLYYFDTITTQETNDGTLYSMSMTKGVLNGIMDMSTSLISGTENMDIGINDVTVQVLVSKDGVVKEMHSKINMTISSQETGEMEINSDSTITVNHIGDTVVIEYPDFSDFQETT